MNYARKVRNNRNHFQQKASDAEEMMQNQKAAIAQRDADLKLAMMKTLGEVSEARIGLYLAATFLLRSSNMISMGAAEISSWPVSPKKFDLRDLTESAWEFDTHGALSAILSALL